MKDDKITWSKGLGEERMVKIPCFMLSALNSQVTNRKYKLKQELKTWCIELHHALSSRR
jgi:hypothetical protein